MLGKNKHIELFSQGLIYRYGFKRWERLKKLPATRYGSLKRIVVVGTEEYIDELIQPLVYPMVLSLTEIDQLAALAVLWNDIVKLQLELSSDGWLADKSLVDLGADGIINELAGGCLPDAGYNEPLMPFIRLDLIRTASGFKIVDINSTRPAGVGDNLILDNAYKQIGQFNHFCPGMIFCLTVQTAFNSWCRRQGIVAPARIAMILDSAAGDWYNFDNLKTALAESSWVEQIKLFTNWPGNEIGSFNCIIRGRIKEGHKYYHNLLSLPTDKFCVISPLGRRFIGNKKWFWIFQNQLLGDLFAERLGKKLYKILIDSSLEAGILRPGGWVQLSDRKIYFAKLDKNDWMIKPPAGSSGQGIVIGSKVEQKQWDCICTNPEFIGSVWQSYQPIKEAVVLLDESGRPIEQELYTKYGVFLFNGQVAGVEVMARSSPIVHGARNTYLSSGVWL